MTERMNQTLLGMLGTLEPHQKPDWKSYVPSLVHAYNCTRHESTGFSPFSLMFGREPHLPVDLMFGLGEQDGAAGEPLTKYVDTLRTRLSESFTLATEAARKARQKQKKTYDMKVRGADVAVGDRVLVKVVAFDGKHKIADRWEEDVYVVLSKPNPDIPVFVVQREDKTGRKRTLHRNLLLPLGSRLKDAGESEEEDEEEEREVEVRVIPENTRVTRSRSNQNPVGGDAHSSARSDNGNHRPPNTEQQEQNIQGTRDPPQVEDLHTPEVQEENERREIERRDENSDRTSETEVHGVEQDST